MTVLALSACSASREENVRSIETGIDSINIYGSITLTIGPDSMKDPGYEWVFADGLTAYSQCDIIALDMTMNYDSDDFRKDLADGFRYIASHEGPYLIHCVEGKDRTGYAAAILECLMGAGADEVVEDYMITYYNFYGIEAGTDQYKQIAASNIEAVLAKAFGVKSIYDDGVDLKSCSEVFLKDIGMSNNEISSLRESLSI